jgi:hypothetical protein
LAQYKSAPVTHQAGLAIFQGDGSVITACVNFKEESITGLELLKRSNVPIETATNPSQGTAVCKVGEVGCSASNCFCNMPNYWSYWQLAENGWAYASTGAEQTQVKDGEVDAWSWGSGDPPVQISFQNICEGVTFVMPVATQTSLPPTNAPLPTQAPSLAPKSSMPEITAAPGVAQTKPSSYLIFGSIIVVLAVLIIYLVIRKRV